jgi:hypothetical protein
MTFIPLNITHSPEMDEIGPRTCMYIDDLGFCSKIYPFPRELFSRSKRSKSPSKSKSTITWPPNLTPEALHCSPRSSFMSSMASTILWRSAARSVSNTSALEPPLISWIVPTCFAQSLESLVLLPGPVKDSVGKPLCPRARLSVHQESYCESSTGSWFILWRTILMNCSAHDPLRNCWRRFER